MIKLIIAFIVIFFMFYAGIPYVIKQSASVKYALTVRVIFSIICTLLAIATMTLFVVLF